MLALVQRPTGVLTWLCCSGTCLETPLGWKSRVFSPPPSTPLVSFPTGLHTWLAGPGPWGQVSLLPLPPCPGPSLDPAGHFLKEGGGLERAGCHLLYQMGRP